MPRTPLTSRRIEIGDAFEAIEMYFDRGWSDGLPVVPPTPESVTRFLDAAGLAAGEVLGTEPTKGAVITAEKVAIAAVMAGCRSEYMPVVRAAAEAMTADELSLHAITVSTMGAGILVIVNGPIALRLGINSGVSAFGPGHRANATIGRAVRLIVMNVLGTRPDALDRATLGHPGKYSWCIAENEEASPWPPLHVSRGLGSESSAVTLFAGLSPSQVGQHEANTPEGVLDTFVDTLFSMGPAMRELLIVLCPEHAAHFRSAGWAKERIGEYLFEVARRPASKWAASGRPAPGADRKSDRLVSALASPDAVSVVVAGGAGGGFSAVVPTWSFGYKSRSVTRPVRSSE